MAKEDKAKDETPVVRPVEEWQALFATPDWLFAAARAKYAWPRGQEVTESGYKTAIKAAENEVIR